MPIKSTREKFVHELADLYDAEHQFLAAQHLMHSKATDAKLKTMIKQHIGESEQQVKNLELVFGTLGEKPRRQHCDGAEGIVSEGKKAIEEAAKPFGENRMMPRHTRLRQYGHRIELGNHRLKCFLKVEPQQIVMLHHEQPTQQAHVE